MASWFDWSASLSGFFSLDERGPVKVTWPSLAITIFTIHKHFLHHQPTSAKLNHPQPDSFWPPFSVNQAMPPTNTTALHAACRSGTLDMVRIGLIGYPVPLMPESSYDALWAEISWWSRIYVYIYIYIYRCVLNVYIYMCVLYIYIFFIYVHLCVV